MDIFCKAVVVLTAVCSCACQGSKDTKLVFVVRNTRVNSPSILYVPGDPTSLTELSKVNNVSVSTSLYVHSLGFHYSAGNLYYSVLNPNQFRALDHKTWTSTEYHAGYGDSLQMAVDWSAKNLYWVDGPYRWIAMKPMTSKDPHDFKIVVDEEVAHAISIAIDSTRGYMYWGEQSNISMIKRASLDGSQIEVLAYGGVFAPVALTTDASNGMIYWADTTKDTVEKVNWDGKNRKVIWGKSSSNFRGIAFYKGMLYVTDMTNNKLMKIKIETGEMVTTFDVDKYGSPRAVVVYASENQPVALDPCEGKGCSHFCLRSVSGAKCACQDGFTLGKDGSSCTGFPIYSPRLLSYANKTHICFVNITIIDGHVPVTPYCPVNNGSNIRDTTQNSANQIVYYADKDEHAIYSLSLKTGIIDLVVQDTGDVEGLAFDWLTSTLYWADSAAGKIKSYDVMSGKNATVFSTSQGVTHLAVDPFSRQIFWIGKGAIYKRGYTGGDEEAIFKFNSNPPSSIYVDPFAERLYWVAPAFIRSVDLNGNNSALTILTFLFHNGPLAVYKSLAIWATSDDTGVYLRTGKTYTRLRHKERLIDSTKMLVDVEIIDTGLQRFAKDACYLNGGCEQYCITKQGKKMCACELGYDLQTDQKSCIPRKITGTPMYLTDSMEDRLFRVDMINGSISGTDVRNERLGAVAADWSNSKLYWSDLRARTLRVSSFNATSPKTVVTAAPHLVEDIAVDQETGNIYATYYSGSRPGYIAVTSPDGKNFTKLVTSLAFPRAIALHTPKFKMFWSNLKDDINIERSDMDGKNREVLISTEIKTPNAIVVDIEDDILFWADGDLDKIERCSLDGKTRKVILKETGINLISIAIHKEFLFYIGWNRRSVQGIKKLDGSSKYTLAESPRFGRLEDIMILAPNVPPKPTPTSSSAVSPTRSRNQGGVIAGVVVSILLVCVIIAVVVFFVLRRRKAKAEDRIVFTNGNEDVSTPPAFGSSVGYDTLHEEMPQPSRSQPPSYSTATGAVYNPNQAEPIPSKEDFAAEKNMSSC